MENLDWPIRFLLAFVLGAVVGLEREINERKNLKDDDTTHKRSAILGLRSFSLISGLGALSGALYLEFPIISTVISISVIILTLSYYFYDSFFTKDIGLTTELAIIFTFIIGFLLSISVLPVQLIIALTVVLVLLMSRKENIKNFVVDISRNEINALVSFAILAFVILPFLPNQSFALSDIRNIEPILKNMGLNIDQFIRLELFNPFKLWLIVVLITGVDLLGYILERQLGQKSGWLLTSLIGGFVSSTATTVSIAQESKVSKAHNTLIAGAIFANMASFIPVSFLLITLNTALFLKFFPILIVILLSTLTAGIYFLFGHRNEEVKVDDEKITKSHKIFDLVAALKFVGIFLLISIISKISLIAFGSTGFLLATGLGALTGIDAVVINTAQISGNGISLELGVWALLLANSVNLLAKSAYSYVQGSKDFTFKFLLSILVVIAASIIATLIFN